MKFLGSYILRSICSLLVGFLLVFNPEQMTSLLVQVIGGLFVFSGLFTFISYLVLRNSASSSLQPVFPVVGIGSLLFGFLLLCLPVYFISSLMYLLGGLLIIAGVGQLVSAWSYRRIVPLHWGVFVVPLLILCAGLFVFLNPMESASLPFIILGICSLGYGFSELFNGFRLHRLSRKFDQNNFTEIKS